MSGKCPHCSHCANLDPFPGNPRNPYFCIGCKKTWSSTEMSQSTINQCLQCELWQSGSDAVAKRQRWNEKCVREEETDRVQEICDAYVDWRDHSIPVDDDRIIALTKKIKTGRYLQKVPEFIRPDDVIEPEFSKMMTNSCSDTAHIFDDVDWDLICTVFRVDIGDELDEFDARD